MYSVALAAHVAGLSQPLGSFAREYVIEPVRLKALLLTLARVFKVLHADSLLTAAREGDAALTLEASIVPALLRETGLGNTLIALLEIETAKLGRPNGSDSLIAALLVALKTVNGFD